MKKALSLIMVMALLVGFTMPAFSQFDRETADEAGYAETVSTEHDVALISRPVYIYAVTVWADAANSYVMLYDLTSAPTGDPTHKPKLEVGEATQYRSTRYEFAKPIKMVNGIYADVTSGSVVVEYR